MQSAKTRKTDLEMQDDILYWKSKADKYRKGLRELIALIVGFVFFVAILTFRDFKITVDPNDGSVTAINTSWWGIKKTEKVIRWIKTNDYATPGWMTKDDKGDWYLYLVDE